MKDEWNMIKAKCPWTECAYSGSPMQIRNHEEICIHAIFKYPNPFCDATGSLVHIERHFRNCYCLQIPCPSCNATIKPKSRDVPKHQCKLLRPPHPRTILAASGNGSSNCQLSDEEVVFRHFAHEGEWQDFVEEVSIARASGIFRGHTITEQDIRNFPELHEGNRWLPHVVATSAAGSAVAGYPTTGVNTPERSSTGARMLHEELAGFRFAAPCALQCSPGLSLVSMLTT